MLSFKLSLYVEGVLFFVTVCLSHMEITGWLFDVDIPTTTYFI